MGTLITGAGLVGCRTAMLLAARGEACVLGDIRPPVAETGAAFERLDVTDAGAIEAVVARHGIRRIVHTAAILSNGMRANPLAGLRVNLMGTANVLDIAHRMKVARVVTISSTTVLYSGFGYFPSGEAIPEDAAMRLISDRPRSLYAMTKQTNEQLGLLFRDMYGVDHVALRFAAVVGGDAATPTSVPGQLFDRLIGAARMGGTLTLDDPLYFWGGTEEFVDLRDCAAAILAALDAGATPTGIYNIAHPRQWRFAEVVDEVARQFGPFTCRLDGPADRGFAGFPFMRPGPSSTDAARAELGFACTHGLGDSLAFWWPRPAPA